MKYDRYCDSYGENINSEDCKTCHLRLKWGESVEECRFGEDLE